MKKIFLSMIALVSFVCANAQVTLSIDDVTLTPGETTAMTVNMDNTVEVNGFQFDLFVPEGVTVETAKPNKPKVSDRAETHTITTKAQESGAMRFMVVSMDNDVIEPGTGAVMTIYLTAASNATEGSYSADVTGVTISHSGNQKLVLDPFTWNCTIGVPASIEGIQANNANCATYAVNGVRTNSIKHGISVVMTENGAKKILK